MAKKSGLGAQMYVGGYDLSNDTGSINNLGTPRGVLELTGMNKSAYERILTFRDGAINWSSFFNPSAGQSHLAYRGLPTADTGIIFAQSAAIGDHGAAMICKQINYDGNRANNGAFTFGLSAQANSFGIDFGQLLTAGVRTDTTATNGAGLESPSAASTAFGLQAYCHLMAFTGTSVTIKLVGDDNSGFTTPTDVTGGSFGALTTPRTTYRLMTANNQTIERYLRVVTTGTFTNAVFAVMVCRNDHAGVVV